MKSPSLTWTPFFTLLIREIRRFFKVFFQTVASPLISTLLYLLIFGVSVGKYIEPLPGVSYISFILPGLVMMSTLRNAFDNASGSIITSKFGGELESLKMAPVSTVQMSWAYSLGALVRGLIVGIITLIIGTLFEWISTGTLELVQKPFTLFLFLSLGGLALGNLGLITAIVARSIEHVAAISTFILLPIIYLGGVFFSLDQLHPFWQAVSKFNPLLYFVNGLRYSFLGVADFSLSKMLVVCIAFLILTHLLSLLALAKGSFKKW